MSHQQSDIKAVAEYICLHLHPKELQSSYVQDIRVLYSAEPIVYVLQALSAGMTSLFVGLITNYLYDKTKKSDQKLLDLETLLKKQQEKLQELETYIANEKELGLKVLANKHLELHRQTFLRIESLDQSIYQMVDEVLFRLKQRGKKALTDEVDSHFR
jgi:hypothetical protein